MKDIIEAMAEALHADWQGNHSASRSWAETCAKLPGQADMFRDKAAKVLTAALEALVATGKAQNGFRAVITEEGEPHGKEWWEDVIIINRNEIP